MDIQKMANALRFLALDEIAEAASGHSGIAMGAAELVATLHAKHLRFSPKNPRAEGRDRFILSAGHGSALLYAALYLRGDHDIGVEDLQTFRKYGSKCAGHPEYGALQGIETTTGPLGQGLATATGMAIATRKKSNDAKIYVLVGDGCLMEGISEEAISLAGTQRLSNLIVLWDNNNIVIDGAADSVNITDQGARFAACGWNTYEVKDGHDCSEIDAVLAKAKTSDKPAFVSVKTTIGKGLAKYENSAAIHGKALSKEEVAEAKRIAHYPEQPFAPDEQALNDWRAINCPPAQQTATEQAHEPLNFLSTIPLSDLTVPAATRAASGKVLDFIVPQIPNMLGGTADLSSPTCTKTKSSQPITAENPAGNFIEYGVREHAMGAIMNGLALEGLRPYGGTFLVFSDYMRPAIRLACIMKLPVIYVFTHDSIFVGEDGPTHEPVEQLASLRAIPNLTIFRPCDGFETAEAWDAALKMTTPVAIILSRQELPPVRSTHTKNLVERGAYLLVESLSPQITLVASGSEVHIAMQASVLLARNGIPNNVVSMPSWEVFEKMPEKYRKMTLSPYSTVVSIEAGSTFGWERYAKICIGVNRFGASGDAKELSQKFHLTAKDVVDKILKSL